MSRLCLPVGSADRHYLDEVLADGFGNKEPADMTARFEHAFAERFGVPYAISCNSGSGTPAGPACWRRAWGRATR